LLLLLSAALVLNFLARSRGRRTDPCGLGGSAAAASVGSREPTAALTAE